MTMVRDYVNLAVQSDKSSLEQYSHTENHTLTWRSPVGKKVDQIDHILVNGNMRTSILHTRVMRGAEVYSEHYLVRTRTRLTLARIEGEKIARERFAVCKLQSEEVRRRYKIEVRNRFEALGDIEDSGKEHNLILPTYRDAAKKDIGRSKQQSKPWIGGKRGERSRRGKRQN